MDRMPPAWATRMLWRLLREGDGDALLGDLIEDRERRRRSVGPREAARWHSNQVYASLAAVLRLRVVEFVRTAPWGVAIAAYALAGVFELAFLLLLARVWPEEAHPTSALRLVLEFPGFAGIAYVASRYRRGAAFVLGGLMFFVAVLLNSLTSEALSSAYIIASLTVGPLAACLGGLVHRRRGQIAC